MIFENHQSDMLIYEFSLEGEMTTKDLAYELAANISRTRFEDLSEKAVVAAKKSIIDTLGVIIGASGITPALKGVVELAVESGEKTECSILGFGGKTSPWMAAFANGAMGHCLDYDDFEYESTYHPSSSLLPASLAIAEKSGPVSGKNFLTAFALAQDMGIRMALAIPAQRKPPWHRSVVIGTFACAASCAKLLNLEKEGIVDTLGIALCQAAGPMELRWSTGSDLGGMYPAFPAKAGVLSALLAQKGIAGIKVSLEGKAGLFNLYFDGKYKKDFILADLGRRFAGENTAIKPWPACAENFTVVDATLKIMKENKLRTGDVEKIIVHVGDFTKKLCEPLEFRRAPTHAIDAKFSIPFSVAVAAVRGDVTIDDYEIESLKDQQVLAFAQRVEPFFDQRLNIKHGMPPGVVEIKTIQGNNFKKEVKDPYGHPANPISWEGIRKKFEDCARHSMNPPSESNINRLFDLIEGLEKVKDMKSISMLLTP